MSRRVRLSVHLYGHKAQATAECTGSKAVAVPRQTRANLEARQCCSAARSFCKGAWPALERKGISGEAGCYDEVSHPRCYTPCVLATVYPDALQVFLNADGAMYAFKGMAGRLAPIGVHASMLGILAGVAWGGAAGYKGSVMAPQGGEFLTASALRPASPLAQPPPGTSEALSTEQPQQTLLTDPRHVMSLTANLRNETLAMSGRCRDRGSRQRLQHSVPR